MDRYLKALLLLILHISAANSLRTCDVDDDRCKGCTNLTCWCPNEQISTEHNPLSLCVKPGQVNKGVQDQCALLDKIEIICETEDCVQSNITAQGVALDLLKNETNKCFATKVEDKVESKCPDYRHQLQSLGAKMDQFPKQFNCTCNIRNEIEKVETSIKTLLQTKANETSCKPCEVLNITGLCRTDSLAQQCGNFSMQLAKTDQEIAKISQACTHQKAEKLTNATDIDKVLAKIFKQLEENNSSLINVVGLIMQFIIIFLLLINICLNKNGSEKKGEVKAMALDLFKIKPAVLSNEDIGGEEDVEKF